MALYDKYFGPASPTPMAITDTLKALVKMSSWPVQ
jgi:hypothetical protein